VKVKVCIITTVHHVFDTRIFYKEAVSLVQHGYDLTLIAQHEVNEIVNGVKIVGLPSSNNRLHRFLNLNMRAYHLAVQMDADIYHIHDPEIIPIALMLKIKGYRIIYDVHEDVPKQVLSKEWIWKPLRIMFSISVYLLEIVTGKFFDGIVAATPDISKRFPRRKTIVVHNYPLIMEHSIAQTSVRYSDRNYLATYVGSISKVRGIEEMLKSINLIPLKYKGKLLLGGQFISKKLEEKCFSDSAWEKVVYLGWLDRNQVMDVLSRSRVGLVLIHPEPRYKVSYPVKLFEYMAAGLPVIVSDFPLWKSIVHGYNCGLTVNPLDQEAIAAALTQIFDHPEEAEMMGLRGRKAVEEELNWEREEQKLLQLYCKLIGTPH